MEKLAVCIMVKNESKTILKTLESVKDHIKYYVILDTGSTDDTIEVITAFCSKNKKELRLGIHPFIDFAQSRNILLKHAQNEPVEYFLLLDANEEVENLGALLTYLDNREYTNELMFCVNYKLLNDAQVKGVTHEFSPIRVIRNIKDLDDVKISYKMPVHEYLKMDDPKDQYTSSNSLVSGSNFLIKQDRLNSESHFKRLESDIKKLVEHYENKKTSLHDKIRCCKYICQSYKLYEVYDPIYKFSILGIQLINRNNVMRNTGVFSPDMLSFLIYQARACYKLKKKDYKELFIKAYNYSIALYHNAEILYDIARIEFYGNKNAGEAYQLINLCCTLPIPHKDLQACLPISYDVYNIKRYELRDKVNICMKIMEL